MLQRARLLVFNPQNLWFDLSCGILGHRLSRASLPYLRGFEIEPRPITVQHSGGYERLVVNNHDPST